MRKMNWVYLLVIFATIVSCKKTPLPTVPEGNDPIYTLTGLIEEDSLNWAVGEDNVKLRVGTDEINGVKTYYSQMESVLDNEIFRIEFTRPEKTRIGDEIRVLQQNSVDFLVHEPGRVEFDFGAAGSEVNILQLEDASGNWVSSSSHELEEFGNIAIRAKVNHYGNDIYTFNIKHGYEDQRLNSAYHVQGGNDTIGLDAADVSGNHEWYVDDILVSADPIYVGAIENGVHSVMHKVTDAEGNEASTNGLVQFKWGKKAWDMKVNYEAESSFEPYNYGRVIVSLYKNGQWYRSDKVATNMERKFEIDDITYIHGEGNDVSLISYTLSFHVVVYNESFTESLVLSNVSGTFNVGIE